MNIIINIICFAIPILITAYVVFIGQHPFKAKIIVYVASALFIIAGIINIVTNYLKEKKRDEIQKKILLNQERIIQSLPEPYTNGLPDKPILKDFFNEGQKLKKDSKFKEAIIKYEQCLNHSNADISNKTASHILIGNCFYYLSQYNNAEKHYKSALKLSTRIKDNAEKLQAKSSALGNIGIILKEQGKYDDALKYHNEALEINKKTGNDLGTASTLGNIGIILKNQGKYEEALKHHNESLKIKRKIGNELGTARSLNNIGLILQDQGKYDEALKYHNQALEIDRKIGHNLGTANALGNIGVTLQKQGKYDEALKYYNEAMEIFKRLGVPREIKITQDNIAIIKQKLAEQQNK